MNRKQFVLVSLEQLMRGVGYLSICRKILVVHSRFQFAKKRFEDEHLSFVRFSGALLFR